MVLPGRRLQLPLPGDRASGLSGEIITDGGGGRQGEARRCGRTRPALRSQIPFRGRARRRPSASVKPLRMLRLIGYPVVVGAGRCDPPACKNKRDRAANRLDAGNPILRRPSNH